jgi:hypothetical protein
VRKNENNVETVVPRHGQQQQQKQLEKPNPQHFMACGAKSDNRGLEIEMFFSLSSFARFETNLMNS